MIIGQFFFAQLKEMKEDYVPGQQLNVDDMFKAGDLVDIAGKTIGKGFQGGQDFSCAHHGAMHHCLRPNTGFS